MKRTEASNSAALIAELRKHIQSRKGMADRAQGTVYILQAKIRQCREEIRLAEDKIQEMGGVVRSRRRRR